MTESSPKLILHVGQAKTGTSMLQSTLANSVVALASGGIVYPEFRDLQAAASGKITSGNINSLEPNLKATFDRAVSLAPSAKAVLFSNEYMYHHYERFESDIQAVLANGVEVEMILFVRDPMDQMASGYGQLVKRQGETGDFVEILRSYEGMDTVQSFIRRRRDEGVLLHIANYSRHSRTLLQKFCEFLGISHEVMSEPPIKTVNRSLTGSELHLIRRLNRKFDVATTSAVADALCHELPDLAPARPYLSREHFDEFCARVRPFMDGANELLPEHERYELPTYDEFVSKGMMGPDDELRFTAAQLDIIVDLLPDDIPQSTAEPVKESTPEPVEKSTAEPVKESAPEPVKKGKLSRLGRKLFARS